MPFPLANPNNAIRPDFTTEEHADARQQLIDNGIPEAQVSAVLTNLWTQTNEKEKIRWATRLEEEALAEAEAQTRATEEEAQRQKELDDEDAKFLQEEQSGLRPLSRTEVTKRIANIAATHNMPNLKGHSLRIGGTLHYLLRGTPFDVVKSMGRWAGDSFTLYLRQHAVILAPYLTDRPDILDRVTRYTMPPVR
ncbi:hypothetical protein PAXINDRAFT_13198 [Paxillus involutus ATCC 200175]|uniref:Tyr recombinase domain-containing protein n=1 Tax=Paxillus involutus ATCC 200175 TaxID=664439 RepID=A0A0C9TUE9_PAXIN|nr:hypothetical protein PAXINDRAFT_13198 [Paxillus involutus ATCC 200175]